MNNFYKALFSIILFPLFTLAQSNYKPGLVVTLKGDTVRGFIDYKEWENSPGSVNFKPSLDGSATRYTPNEISYFQVEQLESYRSYSGRVSMDATNINHISTGKDTSSIITTVFLKLEQDGKNIALYSYTDDLKTRYFVVEKTTNEPSELVYRTYNNPGQINSTINETKYKGQLIYLSSKYDSNTDELRTSIENSGYDQELVNIINKINHSTPTRTSAHKKSGISFYAGISTGPTSLTPPDNDGNFTYRNVSPAYSYLPAISFGINIYTNPEVGKLIFRGEVGLSANAFKTYFNSYYNTSSNSKSYFTVNQYSWSVGPRVLYNLYNSNSFKFYVEGGVSLSFSKYSNVKLYDGLYNTTNYSYIPFSSNVLIVPLSAGIVLSNSVGIFVSYTVPVIISENNYTYHNTQIGLSYTFGRKK